MRERRRFSQGVDCGGLIQDVRIPAATMTIKTITRDVDESIESSNCLMVIYKKGY